MNIIQKTDGFTLIELIIAVSIIAILAAIAVPNYRNHVTRANRSDAKAALLHIAAEQEKFYMQNNTYADSLGATGLNIDAVSANDYYDLEIASGDANGFVATATPVDGESQSHDAACTAFSVNEQGDKTAAGTGTDPSANCWR